MRHVFHFISLGFFALGFCLLALEKEGGLIALGGAALAAIYAEFKQIKKLKLSTSGVEAEMREVLEEAKATLEQVKSLAKISAFSSLANTARSGWLGGVPEEFKLEIIQTTEKQLTELGFISSEVLEITRDYHNCILATYKAHLLGYQPVFVDVTQQEIIREWTILRETPIATPVHPKVLHTYFDKLGLIETYQKRLEGYEHYFNHQKFLDFEDFKNRRSWPKQLMPTKLPST